MLFFVWGFAFFGLGLVLLTNYRGFTETSFAVLSRTVPTSSSAKPGNLRAVGAIFTFLGLVFFVPEVVTFFTR